MPYVPKRQRRQPLELSSGSHDDSLQTDIVHLEVSLQRIFIDILPLEVLQHIFTLAVQPEDESNSTRGTLTHVCEYWRTAALYTPLLWCKVRLVAYGVPNLRQICEMDFARARSSQMDLILMCEDVPQELDWTNFLCLALKRKPQWRSLRMSDLPEQSANQLVGALGEGSLPNLRSVDCDAMSGAFYEDSLRAICGASPNLSSFSLKNATLPQDIPYCPLIILKLSSCSLPPITTLIATLNALQSLRTLEVFASLPYETIHHRGDAALPVLLPRLENLSLSVNVERHDTWFISQLECSNLRHLQLCDSEEGYCEDCTDDGVVIYTENTYEAYSGLVHAIVEKGWKLDTLHIAVELQDDHYNILLPSLVHVRVLSIYTDLLSSMGLGMPSALWNTPDGESTQACVSLEELRLYRHRSLVLLSQALAARLRNPASRLCRLDIDPPSWHLDLETEENKAAWDLLKVSFDVRQEWDDPVFEACPSAMWEY